MPRVADQVRSLARWCSLAVLVEPALVRRLRIELAPDLDVGAEADLWWSHWVESRTTDGVVLAPAGCAELREELRQLHFDGDERPALARELVLEHHRGTSPALVMEEEIAWLSVSHPDPGPEIEGLLRTALAAVVNDGRAGLAPWTSRALARMPQVAREQPSAWYLEQDAHAKLPQLPPLGTLPPQEIDLTVLDRVSGQARGVPLGVLRTGDRLYLGAVGPSGESIEVPATEPRVVEVTESRRTRSVQIPAGDLHRVDIGWGPISLRTSLGTVYEIPPFDGLDRQGLDRAELVVRRGDESLSYVAVTVGEDLIATTTWDLSSPLHIESRTENGQDSGQIHASEVRRHGEVVLMQTENARFYDRLPVRRLRRPPEPGRRWYGSSGFAGLVREPLVADSRSSPMRLQVRSESRSATPLTGMGRPIIVDGEISGLVMAIEPNGDPGGDGDLAIGNWADLWALMYPKAAEATAEKWLLALEDLVNALCLDLHMGFRGLGEVELPSDGLTRTQLERLRGVAEAIVFQTIRELIVAADYLQNPRALSDDAQRLLGLDARGAANLATIDPRTPANSLDPAAAVLLASRLQSLASYSAAQQDDWELLRNLESLLNPGWRRWRDDLAELGTPGISTTQDLHAFLSSLLGSYQRIFQLLGQRLGDRRYASEYMRANRDFGILEPLRLFDISPVGESSADWQPFEGRFDEFAAVFEWGCTELLDAVAAFDPLPQQDGYRHDVYLSYPSSGAVRDWVDRHLLPMLKSALDDGLGREVAIFLADANIATGDYWSEEKLESLRRSRVMVSVVTPSYFTSRSHVSEWLMMEGRETVDEELARIPLIYPILAIGGIDRLPDFAKNRQFLFFNEWVNPYLATGSERLEELFRAVRVLAQTIARNLDRVPAWRSDFPVSVGEVTIEPPTLPEL